MRTVKRPALPLNTNKHLEIEKLCKAYSKEKQHWLSVLRAWKFQAQLGTPRKIRDHFVQEKYKSELQARHWKLALQDAIETWDKYWKAIFVQVRPKIASKLTNEVERWYAYWLLKSYTQFPKMMQGQAPEPEFKIDLQVCRQVARYVQRAIKKQRGKEPQVKLARSAKFDANCYKVFEHRDRQYIACMSLMPGKRILIPLKGKAKIEGNITLVVKKERIEVHVSQELSSCKKVQETYVEAVDFGYTEVMTDVQGNQYGKNLGSMLSKSSDQLFLKMRRRHKLHALRKKYLLTNPRKAKRIHKYNLGRQKQIKTARRAKASIEREINKECHLRHWWKVSITSRSTQPMDLKYVLAAILWIKRIEREMYLSVCIVNTRAKQTGWQQRTIFEDMAIEISG